MRPVVLVALLAFAGCVRVPPMYEPAPAYVPLPARVGEVVAGVAAGLPAGSDAGAGVGLGASASTAPVPGVLLFASVRGNCLVGQYEVPSSCFDLDRAYGGGLGTYFGPLEGRRVELLAGYEAGRAGARGFRSYEEELEGVLTERRSEVEQAFVQVGYTERQGVHPPPERGTGGGPTEGPDAERSPAPRRAYVGWALNLRATAVRFTRLAEAVEGEPQAWPTERRAFLLEPGGALTFGVPRSLGRWALGLRLAVPVVSPAPVTVSPLRIDVGYAIPLDRLF